MNSFNNIEISSFVTVCCNSDNVIICVIMASNRLYLSEQNDGKGTK